MFRVYNTLMALLGLCLALLTPLTAHADDLFAPLAEDFWHQNYDRGYQNFYYDFNELKLEKAVLLMRHGVRPPTSTPKFQVYASQAFPTTAAWGAPDGNLTPNGATRITTFGQFERELFSVQGLLKPYGCPAKGDLFVWADNADERTQATGLALLQGLYPGCTYPQYYSSSAAADLLFSPNFALNTSAAEAAVLARMGGSFAALQAKINPLLAELGNVLGCCSTTICDQLVGAAPCGFADIPWSFTAATNSLSFNGALATGSSTAEIFQLEYENGFTGTNVAFGNASTPEAVRKLMALYTTKYYYFDRTPILAQTNGSDIGLQILDAVEEGAGINVQGGPPAGKLTVFVGHDSTISAIGGMLNLNWHLRSYQPDDMPAGGALGFELLSLKEGRHKSYFVRPVYLTATLEQTHFDERLSAYNPPIYESLRLDGCSLEGGKLCTLQDFITLMTNAINPAATAPEVYQ